MLVPVISIHGCARSKPRAATTSVPSAPTSGLKRPSRVGPRLDVTWAALRADVDVGHREDPLRAGERADHAVVGVGAGREERRVAPAAPVRTGDAARVVALDPGVVAAVAHDGAGEAHPPLARRDRADLAPAAVVDRAEERGQHDRDPVRAVGRVVGLAVDAQHGPVVEHLVADRARPARIGPIHAPPGGRTSTSKRSCGPYQISISFSETSATSSPTTTQPSSWRRPVRGERAAGVDPARDEPRRRAATRLDLAGVAGGDRHAAAGRRERVVDPAGHRARRVVRVPVRAEADVDRRRAAGRPRRRARPRARAGSRRRRRCASSRRSSTSTSVSSGRSATSTPARRALRATPRLPAAIEATCVPCEPTHHLRLRLEAGGGHVRRGTPRRSRRPCAP